MMDHIFLLKNKQWQEVNSNENLQQAIIAWGGNSGCSERLLLEFCCIHNTIPNTTLKILGFNILI